MKFLPLFTLALTTTATVVGTAPHAQAADMTQQSKHALHQIYNNHKIDEAHWNLLVAVAKQGTVVRYHTQECNKGMGEGWTLMGYYGWDGRGNTEMVLCNAGMGTAALQQTIRHEAGHKIQDLKDGGRGDGRLMPFYNTQSSEFWGFYSKSSQVDHEYVETYNKGGIREDLHTYHLEADAEVQATESAQELANRLFKF